MQNLNYYSLWRKLSHVLIWKNCSVYLFCEMPKKALSKVSPPSDLLETYGHVKRSKLIQSSSSDNAVDSACSKGYCTEVANKEDLGEHHSSSETKTTVVNREEVIVNEKKTRKSSGRSKVIIQFDSDEKNKTVSNPHNWQALLENIREMRKGRDAPVDTMGCDMHADPDADPKIQRYHTLVSLMLSPQTKDQVTDAAMKKLKAHGLMIENVLAMSDETLGELIYPVGFWKTKVKNLKKVAAVLQDEYDSDIPDTVENLCKLPGVGPKIAYLAMNIAWNKVTGIGVDTHVHRISNRLGWVGKKGTKAPEETRVALESWLPQELWSEVNHILVGFGQTICTPVRPKCDSCLNNVICPSAFKELKGKLRK